MENLIGQLYELIKDHREEEEFMTLERVKGWVMQFEEEDREFILEETIHIFKKRYISKENGRKHVKYMIEFLAKTYKYDTVKEFIPNSYFINNHSAEKSQNILLEFLNEILKEDYDTALENCNIESPQYVVYLDDILCTGETIIRKLSSEEEGWFNMEHPNGGTNYDSFMKTKSVLVLAYLAVHKYCISKFKGRLYYSLGEREINDILYVWNKDFEIDNLIDNPTSALNIVFPIENDDEEILNCKEQIEQKVNSKGRNNNKVKYRSIDVPENEKLFSSSENRNRYEKIILKKSIEYYNHIPEYNLRARPLGYGLNHDVSFGFGTMIFTWRNVPFNTPLVFWYSHHNCTPLFERIFT